MYKILIVDRFFYPDLQATSVILTDLATELSKDFEVKVICGPPSFFKETSKPDFTNHIKIHTVPAFDFPKHLRIARILNYSSFLLTSFVAVLFSQKPDVAICQTAPPLVSLVLAIAAKLKRFSYIHICQDMFPQTAIVSKRLNEGWFTKLVKRINLYVSRHAARVISIGRDMTEKLTEEGCEIEKIKLIPNWVDINEIQVKAKPTEFLKKNSLNKFIVLYAGNIGYLQDFDFVFEIAEKLKPDSEIQFVFVGRGALLSEIKAKAHKKELSNIVFFPWQEKEQVSDLLGSADLQLVTTIHGSAGYLVPSKIYSLLASGRPIIGLMEKKSEVAYLIREAGCGEVFERGEVSQAAQFVKNCLSQKTQLAKWGENARSYIEKAKLRENAFHEYKQLIIEIARAKK